jgi:uncharacterized membrane protein
MESARNFFNSADQKKLIDAIAEAERNTSGEIRVHVENYCRGDEVRAAERTFLRLKMQNTRERNGILIYIAVKNRKIAIIGDKGIHEKVGQEFWSGLVERMISGFRNDHKADALAESVIVCGKALGKYFPLSADDKNELSNEISY